MPFCFVKSTFFDNIIMNNCRQKQIKYKKIQTFDNINQYKIQKFKGIYMKKNNQTQNKLSFEEYKKAIDELIATKKIHKLKRQENYFEICNNYWIVDTYIANNGQMAPEFTPNTLSAYTECIKKNYAISIPVQMLDDGNIVCFSHKNLSKVVSTASGYLNNLKLD